MRIAIVLLLFLLAASTDGVSKDRNVTWVYPEGRMNSNILPGRYKYQIFKVEFAPDTTKVHITLRCKDVGGTFRYAPESCLKADGETYRLIGMDGVPTDNSYMTIPDAGVADIVLSFEPLPASTVSFDFLEGTSDGAFSVFDIRKRSSDLSSSSWRDTESGDWIISFFPDFAVYDTKEWNYVEKDFAKGLFTLTDGLTILKLKVGKEKDGVRTLKIGDRMEKKISRIVTLYNAEYPAGAPRTFIDNGFREGDSVMISGWYKDIPAHLLQKSGEIEVSYRDIFTGREQKFSTPLDSLGHFSLKFPVPNTTGVILDTSREFFSIPLEAGCTYYLFNDFSTGQTLWMGERSRLLNEICAFSMRRYPEHPANMDAGAQQGYIRYVKDLLKDECARIDRTVAENPAVSPLWAEWEKEMRRLNCALYAEMVPNFSSTSSFPDGWKEWLCDEIWPTLPELPTAYINAGLDGFISQFFRTMTYDSPYCFKLPLTTDGKIYQTAPVSLSQYEQIRDELDSIRVEIKEVMDRSVERDALPEDLARRGQELLMRIMDYNIDQGEDGEGKHRAELELRKSVLDSLKTPSLIRDICMADYFTNIIDYTRMPLSPFLEPFLDDAIADQCVRNAVHRLNGAYRQIAMADIELGNGVMVPEEELEGLASGEEIFRKVTEPFKGRFILIDVWGTWCGPCKAALKDFRKEREELAPYGVVFMFFANNSPEQSWKNVIAEYGVTGEDVVHYRLPDVQQSALENFLKVKGFPTYVLVNTDGTPLMDINADPRYNSIVPLLQRLKEGK